MTKNPRDHRAWTNAELEADSAGYIRAREAYGEDRAKAAEESAYKDDLRRFTQAFVAAGGAAKDAEAAFRALRNERAAEAASSAAGRADRAAEEHSRRAAMKGI